MLDEHLRLGELVLIDISLSDKNDIFKLILAWESEVASASSLGTFSRSGFCALFMGETEFLSSLRYHEPGSTSHTLSKDQGFLFCFVSLLKFAKLCVRHRIRERESEKCYFWLG